MKLFFQRTGIILPLLDLAAIFSAVYFWHHITFFTPAITLAAVIGTFATVMIGLGKS